LKSSVLPSRILCRARINSVIWASAEGITSPFTADIITSSSQDWPLSFFITVE
jgi:hypothetical protein